MGDKIRKVLMGGLIVLLSYLLIANIIHMIAINEKHEMMYNSDNSISKMIKNDFLTLTSNINHLKTIKKTKHLNENKYAELIGELDVMYSKVKDSNIINVDYNRFYNDKDTYKLLNQLGNIQNLAIINSYQTIIDNDSTSGFEKDRIINEVLGIMINISNVQNKLISNYQYQTVNDNVQTAPGVEIESIYLNNGNKITLLKELTDYLVKDGGLSE